jgi:GAF domain-containing protein
MTQPAVPGELRTVLARASGRLIADQTVDTLLRLLTSAAARMVASASGAGLTAAEPAADMMSIASTDPVVEQVDTLQYQLGEGPCLTAWRDRTLVRVDDVSTETRWPRWAEAAARTSVTSSLSAPLVVGNSALGAVKVYAAEPRSFTAEDEATLRLFAAQAAMLLAQAEAYRRAGELSDNLSTLLRQRDDINRACGVLMERESVPAESALTFLMSMAERDGRSVHETAARLLRRTSGTRTP